MGKIKYLMDTGGYCFICLKLAKTVKLNDCETRSDSDAYSDTTNTTPVDGREFNDPRTYSFRNICEYLNINLQEVCSEALPISPSVARSFSILEKAEVKGALCSECVPFFERFSITFHELDVVKMKLNHYLKSIYERMVEADKFQGEFADLMLFEQEMLRRHETALRNQFVEQLRRKTLARCSTVIGLGRQRQPVIILEKMKGETPVPMKSPVSAEPVAEPVVVQLSPNLTVQPGTVHLQVPPNGELPQGGTVQLQLPPDFELPAEGTVHLQLPPDMEIPPGETLQIHLPPNVEVAPGETVQLQFLENVVFSNDETMQTYSVEEPSSVQVNVEEVTLAEPTSEIPVVGTFRCGLCPSSTVEFKSYKRFEKHYRRVHLEPPKPTEFNCDLCDKVFSRSYSLTHHRRTAHLGGRYQCKFCSKTFRQSDNRRRHVQLNCPARYPGAKQLRGRKKQNPEAEQSHKNATTLVENVSCTTDTSSVSVLTPDKLGTDATGESAHVPCSSPTISSVDGVVIITNKNKSTRPSINTAAAETPIPEGDPVAPAFQIEVTETRPNLPTQQDEMVQLQNGQVTGPPLSPAPGLGKLTSNTCPSTEIENDEALQLHHNLDQVLQQEGRFKCDYCYKSFTRKSALKRHMQMHCTMRFRHASGKDVNVSPSRHPEDTTAPTAPASAPVPAPELPDSVLANSYECYICSKLYPLISPKDHEKAHHHGQKILCQVCHQRFLQNSNKLRQKGPRGPRKREIHIERNTKVDVRQSKRSKSRRAKEAAEVPAINPETVSTPDLLEPTTEAETSAILFSLLINSKEESSSTEYPNITSNVVESPPQNSVSSKTATLKYVEAQLSPSPNEENTDQVVENGEKSESHSGNADVPDEKFKCNSCDKTFMRKSNYTRHQQLFHFGGAAERIQCKFCDKSFHHLRLLSRHVRLHGKKEDALPSNDNPSSSRSVATTTKVLPSPPANRHSKSKRVFCVKDSPDATKSSSGSGAKSKDAPPPSSIPKRVSGYKTAPLSAIKRSSPAKLVAPKVAPPLSDNLSNSRKVAVRKCAPPINIRSSSRRVPVPKEKPTQAIISSSRASISKNSTPSDDILSSSRRVTARKDPTRLAATHSKKVSAGSTTPSNNNQSSSSSKVSTAKDVPPSAINTSISSKVPLVKNKKPLTQCPPQGVPSSSPGSGPEGPPPPQPGSSKYKFCVCKTFSEREKMVRCENEACMFGSWFHYANDPPCVKYNNEEEWYCVMCQPTMQFRKTLRKFKGFKLRTQ